MDPTRWAIMRQGIVAAVSENSGSAFRWGLIRLRQRTPAWRTSPSCDKPARLTDLMQSLYSDTVPCNAGGIGKFAVYAPSVSQASYAQTAAPAGTVMVTPAANTGTTVVTIANRGVGDNAGIIPAGLGDVGFNDRPIDLALVDAKAAAIAAMGADTAANRACRNTVVILITGGKDDGNATYNSAHDPASDRGAVHDGHRRRRDPPGPDSRHRRQAGGGRRVRAAGHRHVRAAGATRGRPTRPRSPRRSTTPCRAASPAPQIST